VSAPAPLFSIVTPVYNPSVKHLRQTIASVRRQTCPDWEWIVVDDASPDERVRAVLREAAAADDRIRVVERPTNGHIVTASNDGIAEAKGEFVALLDHDDLLVPRALAVMQRAILDEPDVDYLYSDENKVDESGTYYAPFRKPPWSPERLRGQMYTSHLSVLRTSVVREVGGFHEGFDGSQDHDLVLRVTERARKVVHVPKVLYHWRAVAGSAAADPDAKPYAWTAGQKAVQAHMDRIGQPATVELGPVPGTYRLERRLDPEVRVSVVIPTRGGDGLVWGERRCFVVEAVRSILQRGGHDNLEVVVVYDTDTPHFVLDALRQVGGARIQLVHYGKAFNFSEKCNLGVTKSFGDVVLLLNDDVEVASDNFVPNLVAPLFEDGVGMTGARLIYPDNKLQHAGLVFYGRHLSHAFYRQPDVGSGPFNVLAVNRECSGLTGACVALLRSTYDEVGGLTETLPVNYNDVDFSFKIARAGLSLIWVNNAKGYHFESQTRVAVVQAWEYETVSRRWRTPDQDVWLPDYGFVRPTARKRSRRR
jgi:O-antigen biosynthesis protein